MFARHIQKARKHARLSRAALADKSTVPAPTIKRFETTGEISLRQLMLLWVCVDDLDRLVKMLNEPEPKATPKSIEDVLKL
jgi:hypothetical protein